MFLFFRVIKMVIKEQFDTSIKKQHNFISIVFLRIDVYSVQYLINVFKKKMGIKKKLKVNYMVRQQV